MFNGLLKGVNINGLGGEGAKQRFEDELETDQPRDSRSERAGLNQAKFVSSAGRGPRMDL